MADRVTVPPDAKLTHALNLRKVELGLLGTIFGSASEQRGNIAGFAIVLSMAMILLLALFVPKDTSAPTDTLYTLFGGVITTALGYLFGKAGS